MATLNSWLSPGLLRPPLLLHSLKGLWRKFLAQSVTLPLADEFLQLSLVSRLLWDAVVADILARVVDSK